MRLLPSSLGATIRLGQPPLQSFLPNSDARLCWPQDGHSESHVAALRERKCVHALGQGNLPHGESPEQGSSTRTVLYPSGHVAMSGDVFGSDNCGQGAATGI